EAYLTRVPDDAEALDLEQRLRRERSPSLTLGHTRTDDSDEQRVGSTAMELRLPLGGRTMAAAGWQRDNTRDPFGTRDPLRIGGSLETVWSATWTTRE